MQDKIVTVVGASGALGGEIVRALLERGVQVRAMVRATSNRSKLEAQGVKEFLVADLNDTASLNAALAVEPRADAVISSAAGFTTHSARTQADNTRTDIEGYRSLVDATKTAGIPRFVFISILACDRAPGIPHFRQKRATEVYLEQKQQPYISLRAGAFLDRGHDIIPENIRRGVFPDILPGVPMSLVYSRDLARYAAQAALDLPESALNQAVDIGSATPATGEGVARAFAERLGRPIVAKPVFSPLVLAFAPLVTRLKPRLHDNFAVMKWLRKGGYVSDDPQKQERLFGDLPSVAEIVGRYARDKGASLDPE